MGPRHEWLRVVLLSNRRIGGGGRLGSIYVDGVCVRIQKEVILASSAYTFRYLWVRINYITRLLGGRFRNYFHRIYVTVNYGRGAGKSCIKQIFFKHLIESTKSASLVSVVVKHLLLSYRSKGFDCRRFIGGPDCRFPSGYADRD